MKPVSPPSLLELPYQPDVTAWFEAWADQPWAMLLDSSGQGRYDIVVAQPRCTLVTRGEITEIRRGQGNPEYSHADPLARLREEVGNGAGAEHLPFCGGALGYFGYDLARRLERLPARLPDLDKLPEMAVGIYDWAAVIDHQEQRAWLAGRQGAADYARLARQFRTPPPPRSRQPWRCGVAQALLSPRQYAQAFARVKRYIHDGDCYQVNLAQCFSAECEGDPWLAYRRLRRINPAPFAAYLHTPAARILSASPERFLHVRDRRVETRPIKGTRPRDLDPRRDAELAAELQASPKDRAENVMIVDLLRNDLGKTCAVGSIRVPQLCKLESFARVHHLVSAVTGELRGDAVELLRGCFPGGSITGAPKRRAMQIIEELEACRRGVYCGAIGYIGFDGNMDTNIAIRTLVHTGNTLRFYAGGGIVADSELAAEAREILDKAAPMLELSRGEV